MTQALYSAAPNIGKDVMAYISELEAQAAAMREILETVPEMCLAAGDVRVYSYRGLYEQADKAQAEYRVMLDKWAAAIAPDAGKALLERLVKAEAELESYKQWETKIRQANDIGDISLTDWASFMTGRVKVLNDLLDQAMAERVEATSLESYCRGSGCVPYQEGAWMACEACDLCDIPRYYNCLRSNNMIREAE